ncbi:MAG: poly-gamma-glutamate hydrolase family protein [Cyanobacteria bacterium P01_F01_bin.150]
MPMLIGLRWVMLATLTLVGVLHLLYPKVAIADTFDCYQANQCDPALGTSRQCVLGRDYTITASQRYDKADVIVLSIHGGKIEPHTSQISQALATLYQWNRYDFAGHGTRQCLRGNSNFDILHITSSRFDEPDGIALVKAHPKAVSIHGYGSRRRYRRGTICVGGKNTNQISAFIEFLETQRDGFTAYQLRPIDATQAEAGDLCSGLGGTSARNIVNKTKTKKGLQLELGQQMRQDLVNSHSPYDELRQIFYGAIAHAMES